MLVVILIETYIQKSFLCWKHSECSNLKIHQPARPWYFKSIYKKNVNRSQKASSRIATGQRYQGLQNLWIFCNSNSTKTTMVRKIMFPRAMDGKVMFRISTTMKSQKMVKTMLLPSYFMHATTIFKIPRLQSEPIFGIWELGNKSLAYHIVFTGVYTLPWFLLQSRFPSLCGILSALQSPYNTYTQ